MMYADAEADMFDDPEAEDRLEVAALAGHEPARYLLLALRPQQDDDGTDGYDDPDDGGGYREPWRFSDRAKCGNLNEDGDGDGTLRSRPGRDADDGRGAVAGGLGRKRECPMRRGGRVPVWPGGCEERW